MSGPLKRRIEERDQRIRELEGEVALLRGQGMESDAYRETIRRWKEGIAECNQLRADVEVLRDEAHSLLNRARRYAHVLTAIAHPEPAHVDCDVSKYSACEAARWLREVGQP